MLRIAIVGCGKIADSHAQAIGRIKNCRIVGVFDIEELMSRQFHERYPTDAAYGSLDELLERGCPDVVHITTPPQSHFATAKRCLEAGCHVYVEKPFAINVFEATEIIRIAEANNLKIVPGHDDQFSPAARRLRAAVKAGYLGGLPIHMESYYCYEMGGDYAKALLADQKHWVRSLPGQLLQNIISHGIARIAEYLQSDAPDIIAYGFTSPFLRSRGERELIDELRVMISEEKERTAFFTFSSQMRPVLHQFRLYGPENGIILDHDNQTLICLRGKRMTSYAEDFLPPLNMARQYVSNSLYNARLFIHRDFHMKAGMKWLIESFYDSIVEKRDVPIPYREIILTTHIMDGIFKQLKIQNSDR